MDIRYSAWVHYTRLDGSKGSMLASGQIESEARDAAERACAYYRSIGMTDVEIVDVVEFCQNCDGDGYVGVRLRRECDECAGKGYTVVAGESRR